MYALFAGSMYYPEGGWGDHRRSSPDLDALRQVAKMIQSGEADWWHIIDLDTGRVVERWSTDIYNKRGPLPYARAAQ